MAAIGSLVFCTDCGNLLESNTGRKAYIQCDVCGTENKGKLTKFEKHEAIGILDAQDRRQCLAAKLSFHSELHIVHTGSLRIQNAD